MTERGKSFPRLAALDIFRGMTVILMILVNMPGSFSHVYPALAHAKWFGCTLADLVYPFFLFSVGASGFLSARKYGFRLRGGLVKKILRRTLCLFGIGVLLNLYPFYDVFQPLTLENLQAYYARGRVFGVLQRIGIAYGLGMICCLCLRESRRILFAVVVILGVSWAGFFLYHPALPYDPQDNISRAVDLAIPGAMRCYEEDGVVFDPEGLYGMASAAVSVMAGFLAARVVCRAEGGAAALLRCGLAAAAAGLLLDEWILISKPFWTASYVLYTGGLAAAAFAALLALPRRWTASSIWAYLCAAFGANAFLLYIVSNLVARTLALPWIQVDAMTLEAWQWQRFQGIAPPETASFVSALCCVFAHGILAAGLYHKRWFFKI